MIKLTRQEKLQEISNLIQKGRLLIENRSYETSDWSLDSWNDAKPERHYYQELNSDNYPTWRYETLDQLINFLGEESRYVKDFQENCKVQPTQGNLNQGLGILEVVKKKLETDDIDGLPSNILPRISVENLPAELLSLVDELNDNLNRRNYNSCALMIRKILTVSCFISLKRIGKDRLLSDKELSDALGILQNELKIAPQIMNRVKTAKWIGDSANHSYVININESDVDLAATSLRLFLEELFSAKKGVEV